MRVLIADDDPIARLYLEDALRDWGYATATAEDGTVACRLLMQDDPPEIALLDWMMPGMDGIEICRAVRQMQGLRYTYLVILSSGNTPEKVETALNAGADDFLPKPADPEALEKALSAGARIARLENRLREAAPYDRKAGMHGRDAILGLLHTELHRSERTGNPVSVLLYGVTPAEPAASLPEAACAVLKETGVRIRRVLRPYDMLGRVAEDRVLVVLPDCDALGARDVSNRARAEMINRSGGEWFSLSIAAATTGGPVESSLRIAWKGSIPPDDNFLRELEGFLDQAGKDLPGTAH